jgi:hypothetical protein
MPSAKSICKAICKIFGDQMPSAKFRRNFPSAKLGARLFGVDLNNDLQKPTSLRASQTKLDLLLCM